jgi:hypothetical protein
MTILRKTLLVALALAWLPSARAEDWKSAREALLAAEKSRNPDGFASAAAALLKDDSARAVREVCEAFGRLAADRPSLPPDVHYRLHSEVAQLLGGVGSVPAREEIIREREKSRAWEVRLLCLDGSSFKPNPLDLRGGAIALLRDRTPAVVRRSLDYLKNDRRLLVVDRVLARYLEVDGPKGPKGDDWDRVRLAFRSALSALLKVSLPAAVDYRSYVAARREKPEDLFNHPEQPHGPTKLTIFGAEVSGNNLVFVIDVSGSMMTSDPVILTAEPGKTQSVEKTRAKAAELMEERRRIIRAKRELTKVVQSLPEGKRFNIIAYSSDVVPWKKLLTPVNAGSRKEALEFVANLKADGITVTDDALEAAFADLAADTIYLITDGAPTHVGNKGSEMPPDAEELIERIQRRVREINYFRGVRLFTLGFPEAEENFLKKLAADNAGEYTPIR